MEEEEVFGGVFLMIVGFGCDFLDLLCFLDTLGTCEGLLGF